MIRHTPKISVIAAVLMALPASVHAIGLGDMQVDSSLGKSLRASVGIIAAADEMPDLACIRLLRGNAPSDSEVPRLSSARLSLGTVHGKQRLMITTDKPVNDPVLSIAVHIGCNDDFTKEFTVLLDPPEFQAATAPASAPAEVRPTTQVPATSADPELGQWVMGKNESLYSLASNLYPGNRKMQKVFIQAVREANPGIASNQDKTPFAAGTPLRIPDLRALANSLPAASAATPAETGSSARPKAETKAALARSAKRSRPASEPQNKPQLKIVTAQPGSAPANKLDGKQNDPQQMHQALMAQADDQVATMMTQKARIAELEDQLSAMQQSMATLQTQLAATNRKLVENANTALQIQAQQLATQQSSNSETYWWGVLSTLGLLGFVMALHRWSGHRRVSAARDAAEAPAPLPFDMGAMPASGTPYSPRKQADDQPVAATWPSPLANITVAEMGSALEQAEVYCALGHADQAVNVLKNYIDSHPASDHPSDLTTKPWRKLLEIYRATGAYDEFQELARRYHKKFNIVKPEWSDASEPPHARSLEDFPRLITQIIKSWGTAGCLDYLQELIQDNRGGKRAGFDPAVFDEIIMLIGILERSVRSEPKQKTGNVYLKVV